MRYDAAQPTFFDDVDYVAEATRRFPFSAKRERIYGVGSYALVSKCCLPWQIFLFKDEQGRAETLDTWQRTKCNAVNCLHQHSKVDL